MVAVDMQCVMSAGGKGSGRGVGMIFMHGHAPPARPTQGLLGAPAEQLRGDSNVPCVK